MKKIWLLFGAILAVLAFALFGKTMLQPHRDSVGIDIGQSAPNNIGKWHQCYFGGLSW